MVLLGTMSTSETQQEESDDVECPTCGRRDFASEQGVKLHHKIAHGESLAYTTLDCDGCGVEFTRLTVKVDRGKNNYCSRECHHKTLEKKVTVQCDTCGVEFDRIPAHLNEHNFCSYQCQGVWSSKERVGENAANWQGGKNGSECDWCGENFTHNRDVARFCSNRCYYTHLGEQTDGPVVYYGTSWSRQRSHALQRDNHGCVICGSGGLVDVHHITPFRAFGVENHERANRLENLVCLCRKHHMKWEGIPLRPELIE